MNARNFGLRTSNVERALVTAYQMKSNGDNSKNNCKSPLKDFAKHLKENGVKDLRKVNASHVQSYANVLNERYERGEISASTAQNYLSKTNVAMENARLDRECKVDPVRGAGLPTRTGVASTDRSVNKEQHESAKSHLPERMVVQIELQRHLGLRFKESALIDAKSVLHHAEKTGIIKISDGTKGGRPREFEVNSHTQIDALRSAAEIQNSDRSLIPPDQTWAQYQNQCYREMAKINFHSHGERHYYATERYLNLTGVECPVKLGIKHGPDHHNFISEKLNISAEEARALDHKYRLQIAEELGHSRISITNNYLG